MFYFCVILLTIILSLCTVFIHVSFNPVFSQDDGDDGFFTVPEDEFYNPKEYGIKQPSLSLKSENSNESIIYKEKPKQFIDPKNYPDFKFAVVGDWGCTKNTVKTVNLIHNQNPYIVFSLGDTSYGPDINCWIDIVNPILDKIKAVLAIMMLCHLIFLNSI